MTIAPARAGWTRIAFWLYLFVLILAEATATNPADPDLWHRLAVGEYFCQTGHLPVGGTFSYLADYREIADHEWGSGVLFYGAYVWAGGAAIVAIKLISLAVTLGFLVAAGMQGRAATLLLAAFYALVLLALLPSFQSTVRCMVFTNLFFALWLYWYQIERRGGAVPTWAYVVTTAAWANLHGGFAIGLLWLFGVSVLQFIWGEAGWRWALRFGLCVLATLLNPFGWHLWISTTRALVISRHGFDEWAPLSWLQSPLDYAGYKLLVCVTVAALAVLFLRRDGRRPDRFALTFMVGALGLSFLSVRHTPLFAAVAGAFLPGMFPLQNSAPSNRGDDPLPRLGSFALGWALVIFPLFAAFRTFPGAGFRLQYPTVSCPVAATDFLERRKVSGNLLVPFNYGSYALWRLRGRMRVSMDGRYDLVYRPETYQRVDDFFFARGNWPALLHSPAPAAVLLPIADPVYSRLKASPGWTEAYHDSTDAVFLPPQSPALVVAGLPGSNCNFCAGPGSYLSRTQL